MIEPAVKNVCHATYERKSIYNNIGFVVDKYLCTSCGACAGLCPNDAIVMQLGRFGNYVPVIDKKHCNDCGLCVRVCPGHSFDYMGHYERLHGALPEHIALGTHLGEYVGYTTDEEILCHSQSGGFVSTLLLFCLEEGIIDGAVVTRWRDDSPLETDTYIATDRHEILAAVGSKYNPVPVLQILGTLLKSSGRFAFVGTACQIQGLRKAEEVFPKLADKIALYLGLHCLGVFTYHFHDQMLHKLNISRRDLAYFRYRDKAWRGWMCDMRLIDRQGRVYDVDRWTSRLWPRPYFTNWRCQLCFDKANEFSDVSCGDCRITSIHREFERKGYDLSKGLSEFVIRTERGSQIVTRAISEGRIVVEPADADSLASSIGVAGKKLGINTFFKVARFFRLGVPEYGVRFSMAKLEESKRWKLMKPWAILSSTRYFLTFFLGQYKIFRNILKRLPHEALGKINKLLESNVEWVSFGSSSHLLRFSSDHAKKKASYDSREKIGSQGS